MNIFDLIDSYETQVKANSDLWNEDSAERKKPTYTGVRTILKSLSDTENLGSELSFPSLVFDALETGVMDSSNNDYCPNEAIISITVYCYAKDTQTGYEIKKESYRLLDLVLQDLSVEVVDSVGHIASYLGSYKVFASVCMVTV